MQARGGPPAVSRLGFYMELGVWGTGRGLEADTAPELPLHDGQQWFSFT